MKRFSVHAFATGGVVLALAGRAAWQAWFLLKPMDTLLGLVADDLFYYLAISRNLFAGKGATFDGLAPTNGFHPLFLAVLHPLNLIADPDARAKAALALLIVFDAAACFLFWRILRPRVRPWIALLCGAALALSKDYALIALHGLETPLATLLLACVAWAAFRVSERAENRPADFLALGLLAALTALARTDLGLIALLVPVALLGRRVWGRAGACGLVAFALAALPWVSWNLATFGTPLQSSARTHAYREWVLAAAEASRAGVALWQKQLASIAGGLRYLVDPLAGPAFWAILLAFPAAAVAVLRSRAVRPTDRLWAACLGCAAAMASSYAFFFHFQHWYLHGVLWFALLGLAFALDRAFGDLPRAAGATLALAVAAMVLRNNGAQGTLYYPMMRVNPSVLRAIREELPPAATVGIFSAGYYKYYLPERRILNLDGAVNNAIWPALRARTLYAYLRQADVDYVVDYEVACRQWFALFGAGPLEGAFDPWGVVRSPGRDWDVVLLKTKKGAFP